MFLKPEVHQKTWGEEIWIANSELYCGKLLQFKKDHHSSLHYHIKKTETWYVLKGQLLLQYQQDQTTRFHILNPGDVVHLNPLTPHKLTANQDSTVLEVSTTHHESDTTRISPSGKPTT